MFIPAHYDTPSSRLAVRQNMELKGSTTVIKWCGFQERMPKLGRTEVPLQTLEKTDLAIFDTVSIIDKFWYKNTLYILEVKLDRGVSWNGNRAHKIFRLHQYKLLTPPKKLS